jgi:hypothetical protein
MVAMPQRAPLSRSNIQIFKLDTPLEAALDKMKITLLEHWQAPEHK